MKKKFYSIGGLVIAFFAFLLIGSQQAHASLGDKLDSLLSRLLEQRADEQLQQMTGEDKTIGFSGNVAVLATATTTQATGAATGSLFVGSLIPSLDSQFDLGVASQRWRNINSAGTSTFSGLNIFPNGFISQASSTISNPTYGGGLNVTTTVTSSYFVADVGKLTNMSYGFKGAPGTGLYLAGPNTLGLGANAMSAGTITEAASVATWNIGTAGTFGSSLTWPSNSVNMNDSGITYNSTGHFIKIGLIQSITDNQPLDFSNNNNTKVFMRLSNQTTYANLGIASTTPWTRLSVHARNEDTITIGVVDVASSTQTGTSSLFSILNDGSIRASSTMLAQLTVNSTTVGMSPFGLNYSVSTSGAIFHGGLQLPAGGTNLFVCWQNSGGAVGMLSAQAANCTVSARRFKENISPLTNSLQAVLDMKPVQYTMKASKKEEVGFIAEDMAEIDKRVVVFNPNGEAQTIDYDKLTAYLAGAIQEQQKEIDELKSRIGTPVKMSLPKKLQMLFK